MLNAAKTPWHRPEAPEPSPWPRRALAAGALLALLGAPRPPLAAEDEARWACACEGSWAVCEAPRPEAPLRLGPGCVAHWSGRLQDPAHGQDLALRLSGDPAKLTGELSVSNASPSDGRWEQAPLVPRDPAADGTPRLGLASPLSSVGYSHFAAVVRNEGRAEVQVLEASLTSPEPSPPPVQASILQVQHRSAYRLSADAEPVVFWVPLPREDRAQVPLDLSLRVTPASSLTELRYELDALGNLGARVGVTPAAEEATALRLEWDVVLLRSRRPGAAPSPAEPSWLEATAIAQAEVPRILDPATALRQPAPEDTLLALLDWKWGLFSAPPRFARLRRWWPLDAVSVARRGQSSCTGHANLMTALARAAGLPTRTLAGFPVGEPLQTHYLNETWLGPEQGWRLYEPQWSTAWYPMDDYAVLRMVSPEDEGPEALGPQRFAAAGVPYLSLVEVLSGWGGVTLDLTAAGIGGCRTCDNQATRLAHVRATDAEMSALLEQARQTWARDQATLLAEGALGAASARANAASVGGAEGLRGFLQGVAD